MFDRSEGIRKSVDDVKRTLLLTVVLVILVIYLFLGNPSTTIIASLSLPISLIGTFGAMKLLGFTINNISLMALTLCVGFVVDDAIVVLENIVRHVEMGETVLEAALNGSKEIWFTVVSMTLSLIAVFIPILLMGGIIGRLFFEFAVTMSVAILISGFVSLTLTPMLCSRFLKRTSHGKKDIITNFSEAIFSKILKWYEKTLIIALRHKIIIMSIFVLMVIGTVMLAGVIPKGFLPAEDTGMIMGMTDAAQGISFEDMVKHQQKLVHIIGRDENVEHYMSSVGPAVLMLPLIQDVYSLCFSHSPSAN